MDCITINHQYFQQEVGKLIAQVMYVLEGI